MSNKDHLYLLTDDNGKPVAEKPPEPEIEMTFNSKRIGRLQPLTISRLEELRRPRTYGVASFESVYMGMPYEDMMDSREAIRTTTIEMEIPDILNVMMHECHRYEGRFGRRPQYISLNKAAYRSFWIESRRYDWHRAGFNEDTWMGIDIICNPLQEQPIMALGTAREEGIEGRLYREQS